MWLRLAIALVLALTVPLTVPDVATQITASQRADAEVHAREAAGLAQATTAQRDQLIALDQATADNAALQGQLETTATQRDQLRAKADDLQAQVDKLTNQIAAVTAGVGAGRGVMRSSASGANHFPFGWCTYYVASRRYVPWSGNAITWLWGARAFGFATGSVPRVGAIAVTAESVWGHVAYVEEVSSGGSFLVSEMNYYAWGVVDFRRIVPGQVPVLGFIY